MAPAHFSARSQSGRYGRCSDKQEVTRILRGNGLLTVAKRMGGSGRTVWELGGIVFCLICVWRKVTACMYIRNGGRESVWSFFRDSAKQVFCGSVMSFWNIWLNVVTAPKGETWFVPASYINSPVCHLHRLTGYAVIPAPLRYYYTVGVFHIPSEASQTPVLCWRLRVSCSRWPHWHWHDQRSHGLNVCPSLPWQRANRCSNPW